MPSWGNNVNTLVAPASADTVEIHSAAEGGQRKTTLGEVANDLLPFDPDEAVTADAVLTDGAAVVGDGGVRGVRSTGVLIDGSGNVSGVLTLNTDSGTETNPAICVGELDTGLWRYGPDAISISGGSTEMARFDGDTDEIVLIPHVKLSATGGTRKVLTQLSAGGNVADGFRRLALSVSTIDGNTSASSNAEDTIYTVALPASFWATAGDRVSFEFGAVFSVTGSPTLTPRIKYTDGSTTAAIGTPTALAVSGAAANTGMVIRGTLTCRTTGGTGTLMGNWECITSNGRVTGGQTAAALTFDLTATGSILFTLQWSAASPSNTATGKDAATFAENC